MEIILATHNAHKTEELRKMLPDSFTLSSLNDIQYYDDIIENGKTFEENAWIKAKTAYEVGSKPSISDDSGLCIEALNDAPGIYSSRYAGTGKAEDNIHKVLEELQDQENRKAYFISVISFYDGKISQFFEGRIYGTISDKVKGKNGFGYDPIFIPEGNTQSFAELQEEEKNRISHRALATEKLIEFLKTYP